MASSAPTIILDQTKSAIILLLGRHDGEAVPQAQICDHITQNALGPLPFKALEDLSNAGVIENPVGEATAQSQGEPVAKVYHWQLTRYGQKLHEQHKESLESKRAARKGEGKPAGDDSEKPLNPAKPARSRR